MEHQTNPSALHAGAPAALLNTPPAKEGPGEVQTPTTPNPSSTRRGTACPHSEAAPAEALVINTPPAKEGQGWSETQTTPNPIPLLTEEGLGEVLSPGEPRLPYIAPAIEVIEVRTERGYALSGGPGKWTPTPW